MFPTENAQIYGKALRHLQCAEVLNSVIVTELIINVEDATPCAGGPHSTQSHVADDEMSISSHDTQMSWLQVGIKVNILIMVG